MHAPKAGALAVALLGTLVILAACGAAPRPSGGSGPPGSPPSSPLTTGTPTARPTDEGACPGPPPPPAEESAWTDRVFYEVFVRSFADSDGDGIGDLGGLTARLDYLNDGDASTAGDLGVTGLWLMPVAESPSYHGYDVADHRRIERDYGTGEDFRALIEAAHARGIAVIVDLVLNHTSSRHPWFIDAQTPGSEHETWYLWAPERPGYAGPWGQPVWHRAGDRYYYGLFGAEMPDLNLTNPAVTSELREIARYWLEEMGVDGFRLDAAKHLVEEGPVQANTGATHAWLRDLRGYLRGVAPGALVVGEVWDLTSVAASYVPREVDLAFEFNLADAILDGVRRGTASRIATAQAEVLDCYPPGRYAAFLANHDQTRVMTRLGEDREAAALAATLLLTGPGVPFLYYGEEIGMRGTKPDERIRTPMQWDATTPAAGFSSVPPWEPPTPGFETSNVALETGDPSSLLSHYRRLIRLRGEHPALRSGDLLPVTSDAPSVFAFLRATAGAGVLVVANLSSDPVSDYTLTLPAGPFSGTPTVRLLLGDGRAAAPVVTATGGFEAYAPLPALAPHTALVVAIGP